MDLRSLTRSPIPGQFTRCPSAAPRSPFDSPVDPCCSTILAPSLEPADQKDCETVSFGLCEGVFAAAICGSRHGDHHRGGVFGRNLKFLAPRPLGRCLPRRRSRNVPAPHEPLCRLTKPGSFTSKVPASGTSVSGCAWSGKRALSIYQRGDRAAQLII